MQSRTRSVARPLLALLLGTAASGGAAVAQERPGRCIAGEISEVFVDNASVFDVGSPGLDARFNWAYRLANGLHFRTREEVIRRELLFAAGDCYDADRLEDSERVLRALPFIADADVYSVRQPDGTHHVVVETHDEWTTRLEPQFHSSDRELAGVELREDNLFGTGRRVSVWAREEQRERVFGASYGTSQLLGTHLDADVSVERTPVGTAVSQLIAYPFRGETGRWAFRQHFEHEERAFEYLAERDGRLRRLYFPERRRSFDVGGVFRLGRRGNLTLFGMALAGESTVYPEDQPTALEGEPGLAPGDSVTVPLDSVSSIRAVFLAGQRNVRFDRRRALDAVRGAEDVRLGAEVELAVGRSLSAFSKDDDLSLDVGLFAAGEVGEILGGTRLRVEAKRDFDAPADSNEWRNLFTQVDAWAYWRPSGESRHTFVAAVAGAGGWHTSVPFQLTLGSRAGIRGLPRHVYPGQRRVVATLEHRAYLAWPFPQLFDLGSALFVDAGRSWAGEDPYGSSSPVEVSAGAGLRLAFPPGSRRTYRLDVAVPVKGPSAFSGLQVSLGVGQAVGRNAVGEDSQIRRSSRRSLTPSVFAFPN